MSNSNYTFSQVPKADIPRSSFNRSHGYKTTFNSGYLIPVYVDEALPGDTINLKASLFGRLATPIVPILDNLYLDIFFFAVPNRLLWEHWQAFCGEQFAPGDTTDYTVPTVSAGSAGFDIESLYDYMGMPPKVPNIKMSALFPRAYALIWNEWFRDQNLQDPIAVPTTDGPDLPTFYELKRRGKRHDYFTSALPWPQKGPGVEIPLGTWASVVPNPDQSSKPLFETGEGASALRLGQDSNQVVTSIPSTNPAGVDLTWSVATGLRADLSTATAATINSLRQAFQVQKIYERDARGGTRYTEILRSHFGVVSPDARLQRPEFLGGGTTPITINPVTQTSGTVSNPTAGVAPLTPQGNLAAFGVFSLKNGFTKSFVEHSIIIGLVHVRADLTYQQGIPRQFSRSTRWDFYWPALSHLGEQAIPRKEIYATGSSANDDAVFGYQERWAEYRYFPSQITGKFRSNTAAPAESLDNWHLAQNFLTAPMLSAEFIEDNPPLDRVLAVQDEPQILFDSHFTIKAVRPMPAYSVPGFIDHF